MAIVNPATLGIDVTVNEVIPTQPVGLSVWVETTRYQYVKAVGAKLVGTVYLIDSSFNLGAAIDTTLSAGPQKLGIPATAISDGRYGWVQIQGAIAGVSVLTGAVGGVELYVTATAGSLDDGAFSAANLVQGLSITTTNSSGGTLVTPGFADVELFVAGS